MEECYMFLLSLKKVKSIILALIFCFTANIFLPYSAPAAVLPYMPQPGTMIASSEKADLPLPVGIEFHNNNPFDFNFVLSRTGNRDTEFLRAQAEIITKYFFAALTMPAEDLWVNLSPYEQDHISTEALAQTELGKDLLGEDYVLKQLAASLTYPESESGKAYWGVITGVRHFSGEKVSDTAFNKVWIVPGEMLIEESNGKARIAKAQLKVMCEEDYLACRQAGLAMQQNNVGAALASVPNKRAQASSAPTESFKKYILPSIEQEVNQGKRFAHLRQIYYAVMLAGWFKRKLHDTVLSQTFFDKNKIQGAANDDPAIREKIYNEYVKAFQQGAYNYVKKETTWSRGHVPEAPNIVRGTVRVPGQRIIKRAYFSGGAEMGAAADAPIVSVPDAATFGSRAHVKAASDAASASRDDSFVNGAKIDNTLADKETLALGQLVHGWLKEQLRLINIESEFVSELWYEHYDNISAAAQGETVVKTVEPVDSAIMGTRTSVTYKIVNGALAVTLSVPGHEPIEKLFLISDIKITTEDTFLFAHAVQDWADDLHASAAWQQNAVVGELRSYGIGDTKQLIDQAMATPGEAVRAHPKSPIYFLFDAGELIVRVELQRGIAQTAEISLGDVRFRRGLSKEQAKPVYALAPAHTVFSARRAYEFADRYSFANDTFNRLSAMVRERFPDRGLGEATIWVNQQSQLKKDHIEIFFVGNDGVLPLEVRLQVKSNRKDRSNLQLSLDRNTGDVAVVNAKTGERLLGWNVVLSPRRPVLPPKPAPSPFPTAEELAEQLEKMIVEGMEDLMFPRQQMQDAIASFYERGREYACSVRFYYNEDAYALVLEPKFRDPEAVLYKFNSLGKNNRRKTISLPLQLRQAPAMQAKPAAQSAPAVPPASIVLQPFRRSGVEPLRDQSLHAQPPLIVPRHGSEPEERSDAVAKWMKRGGRHMPEQPDVLKAPIKPVPAPGNPRVTDRISIIPAVGDLTLIEKQEMSRGGKEALLKAAAPAAPVSTQPLLETAVVSAPAKVSLSNSQEQLARAIFVRLLHEVKMKQGWVDSNRFKVRVVEGHELLDAIRQQVLKPSANGKSRGLGVECTSKEEGITRLSCVVQVSSSKEGMSYRVDGLNGRVEGKFSYPDTQTAPAIDGGVKLEQAANGMNIQVQAGGSAFTLDAGWSRPDIKGVRFSIEEVVP